MPSNIGESNLGWKRIGVVFLLPFKWKSMHRFMLFI
jgi:hypothetical protein